MGKCLYCGSTEYQLSKWPTVRKKGGSTQRPEKLASKQSSAGGSRSKTLVRVYALDYQQIFNSTKVIGGIILVFHCLAKVLSDPNTTHSFSNPRFMSEVHVRPIQLPYNLKIKTPIWKNQNLVANLVYRN